METILILLTLLAIGLIIAVICLAAGMRKSERSLASVRSTLAERDGNLQILRQERDQARQISFAAEKERNLAQCELARIQADHHARQEEIKRAQQQADTHFKGIAVQVVESTAEQMRQKANEDHNHQRELAKTELNALVKPVSENLCKLQEHIGTVEKDRKSAYEQLKDKVERLSSDTVSLREILRSSQLRGAWGERSLENLLELAGLRKDKDFRKQVPTNDGRVADFVVRIPGGHQLVIDAKTPFDAYRNAVSATDEKDRKRLLGEHAKKMRDTASALGRRNYGKSISDALDMVVMWVPSDSIVEAAVRDTSSLIEDAYIKHRVLIASPVTTIALIAGVAGALQQERFSEQAQQIQKHARRIYGGLRRFVEAYTKIGNHLTTVARAYDEGIGSLQGNLLSGAAKIRELGGAPDSADIKEPESLNSSLRKITHPALRPTNPDDVG